MANFFAKMASFLGIEDTDDYEGDFYDDSEYDGNNYDAQVEETLKVSNHGKRKNVENVVTLPNSGSMKMIVYHPTCYEDTQHIIDNLKSRKPVVVNMEHLLPEDAVRILDFLSGAVYALNGLMYKVSRGIFIVAPTNYDIISDTGDADEA